MKYIYGPIKSRRIGTSLGISLTERKICSFDCIYCQVGNTTHKTAQRKEYVAVNDVISELKEWVSLNKDAVKKLDYVTFSGYGEPTLNPKIGKLIKEIKAFMPVKVAVITNASLLWDKEVRDSLTGADLIVPSLDAVTQELFEKIDKPHEDISLERVIGGLIDLRKEFKGKIWLEVMFIKGINDTLEHAYKLKEIIGRINPDKIQMNSPVRATAQKNVLGVDKDQLLKIKEILGDKAEII
ncbi:MAG: radical SAM protein [Candidatus Omnitrophota bacterium]|jgi:wyosine [tRNA(Phe)-imidazoG37] synthetase (radical SAM superfamily)|nr:MAG: radical SAM protein [Candidatus Omnitrophota bacterium]